MAHSTASSSQVNRRRGRPPAHVLQGESSTIHTERVDIGIYPSADGRRIDQDAPSPPRKRQRVRPTDLDDEYANWEPGMPEVAQEGPEEAQAASAVAGDEAAGVVSNHEPLEARKRYLSSVRACLYALSPKKLMARTGPSYAHLAERTYH